MSDKLTHQIARIVAFVFIATGTLFTILMLGQGDAILPGGNPAEAEKWLNPFIVLTYLALAIPVFFALVFPISQMITNPKSAVSVLIGIVGLGLVFLMAYALADGNTDAPYYAAFNIDYTWSRLIGASINMSYILGAIAILLVFVAPSIIKLVKK